MARDLKEIKSGKSGKGSPEMSPANAVNSDAERSIGELVDRYKDKSEAELMSELMRVTAQQRREGMLDSNSINSAAEAIMPMLNEKQTKKLNEILSKL